MWWPGSDWYEGHATLATNTTGTAWAVADGDTGIADNARTYLLVASGASPTSDSLRVILVRDAGPPIERVYTDALTPNGRLTIDLSSAFPDIVDERVGVILESMGQTSGGAGHADADRRRARDVQRRQRRVLGRRLEPRGDPPSLRRLGVSASARQARSDRA